MTKEELAEQHAKKQWQYWSHSLQYNNCEQDFLAGYEAAEKKQGWVAVSERLPERVPNKSYSQVQCLVNKRYEWRRGDNSGVYYQIQILTFNHEHECWDGEDGDDHDCAINQVTHWMPLPEPPKPEKQ
jgi:hypothetical protein